MFTTQKRKKLQSLYENYRDYVYWISYNVVHDEYDAEDIVQNSFLKVGGMLDYFEPDQEDKTKMLLSAITKNTAIDYYRKKQKHIEREGSSDPDII
ncbi:MAG: RNA polymerase sigma factor, partial [Lachnospiraceae bacterium]|nr:RNA polymerase sigma factor [Lachnospiraceae bacterium]